MSSRTNISLNTINTVNFLLSKSKRDGRGTNRREREGGVIKQFVGGVHSRGELIYEKKVTSF